MADDSPSPFRRTFGWLVLSLVITAAWLASSSAPAAATPLEISEARSPGIDLRVQAPQSAVLRRLAKGPDTPLKAGSTNGGPSAASADNKNQLSPPPAGRAQHAHARTSFRLVRPIARTPAVPRAPPHPHFA